MKKQKKGFVLAEATLGEVKKQFKVNLFVIVVAGFVLGSNILDLCEKRMFPWRINRRYGRCVSFCH